MLHTIRTSGSKPNGKMANAICGREVPFKVIENPKGEMKECPECQKLLSKGVRGKKNIRLFTVHLCEPEKPGSANRLYFEGGAYWGEFNCKYCGGEITMEVPNIVGQ